MITAVEVKSSGEAGPWGASDALASVESPGTSSSA